MKKSFSLLEIVLTILLISFIYTIFLPKNRINYIDEVTTRMQLYISYVRYKALIDDKFNSEEPLWHKKKDGQ